LTALEWDTSIESVLFEEGTAPKLELLLFEEGTAPKLELLLAGDEISFSGLSCLPSLKEVMIPYDPEVVRNVQDQLSTHPNKPVLKFV
jgi:hypothetical protein